MKIRYIFSLFLIAISMGLAQGNLPSGEAVVRVYFQGNEHLRKLAKFRLPWAIDRIGGFAVLPATEADRQFLAEMGYRSEIDVERTLLMHEVPRTEGGAGIPGFPCYQTVEETFARAQQLTQMYPDLAEWVDVGDSWEKLQNPEQGYDLRILALTNQASAAVKSEVLVVSGLHAREYAPVGISMAFAEWLLEGYGSDANATHILDHRQIHLVLHANPDGRKRAETGILWRKNADNDFCSDTNDRGIDLNRNFPFQWGCCGGSSGLPCNIEYRGPQPESEPETLAITNHARTFFLDQRGDDPADPAPDDARGVFIDIHSFGQWVLWPYGYDNAVPTPNGADLQTLGRKFAWFNNYWPERASVSFNTDGTTDDFAYGEFGVAAYTFEVGSWFFQDCPTFENTILPSNLNALIYAAKTADLPYQRPSGPDPVNLQPDCDAPFQGETVELTVTLDDARFNNANGIEPTQNIQSAAYFIDIPPFQTGASPIFLDPVDGALDSPTEAMHAFIDTAALSPGRHTIYVEGEDASGSRGVVEAIFLTVRELHAYGDWPESATILDLLPICPAVIR